MELKQKIGQLFLTGFQGESIDADHPIHRDIRQGNLGGVILFDRFIADGKKLNNITSPSQLAALTTSLQQDADTPLLIAVDQEGGLVKRLKRKAGFPETDSAQTLGTADDLIRTSIHASCTAGMLHAVGINFNLAPVVDLNIHPQNPVIGTLQRSFSDNERTVVKHAATWVQCHRKQNILSCLKHFPGHGSSLTDSHAGFTDISKSWQEKELLPFKTLIEEGNADAIMMGHLFHSGLDPNFPASLSPAVVTTLLREKLGFTGLVITDDMQMKAITDRYGLEEAVCFALAAGVDMIIIGNNLEYEPDTLQRMTESVLRAVSMKKLNEEQIECAWRRVQITKEKRTGHTNG